MEWMKIPGVEGVGITRENNEHVIIVYSSKDLKKIKNQIPSEVEGHKIIFKQTGEFQAF